MDKISDGRRAAQQIMRLGIEITAYRGGCHRGERDEYLRGWERALRWVMHQEDPPSEFLMDDYTKDW